MAEADAISGQHRAVQAGSLRANISCTGSGGSLATCNPPNAGFLYEQPVDGVET